MDKKIALIGLAVFIACFILTAYFRMQIPAAEQLSNDSESYSAAAIHLSESFFYSVNGTDPYVEREPGYSAFLSVIYFFFGAENLIAIFLVQAALYFISLLVFSRALGKVGSRRIVILCFFLLLLFPPIYKIIFTVYRESFTLSLFFLFSASYIHFMLYPGARNAFVAGVLMGAIILSYYSFVFFPIALCALFIYQKISFRFCALFLFASYAMVLLWGLRNYQVDGEFKVVGNFRTTIMWYVRGEQAEQLQGAEPFMCLWAEYISRDWSGRSSACSVTGLYHQKWPTGLPTGDEEAIAHAGREKIRANFLNYGWNSVFEVLELHLPFVGGGWSFIYHLLAAFGVVIVYAGGLVGLLVRWPKFTAFFFLIILYNTGTLMLTDGTPRYLMQVIFAYVVFSAIGYSAIISLIKK